MYSRRERYRCKAQRCTREISWPLDLSVNIGLHQPSEHISPALPDYITAGNSIKFYRIQFFFHILLSIQKHILLTHTDCEVVPNLGQILNMPWEDKNQGCLQILMYDEYDGEVKQIFKMGIPNRFKRQIEITVFYNRHKKMAQYWQFRLRNLSI